MPPVSVEEPNADQGLSAYNQQLYDITMQQEQKEENGEFSPTQKPLNEKMAKESESSSSSSIEDSKMASDDSSSDSSSQSFPENNAELKFP